MEVKNNNLLGKRFVFATISVVCGSIVTVLLKFDGKTYLTLVGLIVGIFCGSQSYTDIKENNHENPKNP